MRHFLQRVSAKCIELFRPTLVNDENSRFNMINRTFIATLLVGMISFGTVYADSGQKNELTTVYHVYMNDKSIGIVDDKQVVEDLVQKQVQKAQESSGEFTYTSGIEFTYVPEQMFQPVSNNGQVLNYIKDNFYVMAEATALVVDGKSVAYVKDLNDAQEVINELKRKFVSENELAQLELETSEQSIPKLGESIVIDVSLSKEVSFKNEKAALNDILSVTEAVDLLQKGTLEPKKHIVEEGDVLGTIAQQYDLKLKELLRINPNITEDTLLQIGDEIIVMAYKPIVNVIVKKQIHKKETIPFETEIIEDDTIFKGTTKVKQEGKNGAKTILYEMTKENGVVIHKNVLQQEVIEEPVKKIVVKGTKVIPSRGTGEFIWPTVGGYISSHMGYRWGRLHKGIDIARPKNYTIRSVDNGVVEFAGKDGDYGNKVVVNHNNGMKTVYAHLKSISVNKGDTVPQGEELGVMGSTGRSTGVHLHFEVYKNGKLVDPTDYLN